MDKGFTVPTYDISGKKELQTVVDAEDGLYLGHPTTAMLEDGRTILTVYPKCHGYGQIVLKRSEDGGKTWSGRLPVPSSFSTSLEVPTLFRTRDKYGKKRLLLFSGLYPIRMSVSEDDGRSFTELTPIGDYGGIVALGDMCQTAPGKYIALFHDDGRFFAKHPYCRTRVYAAGDGACRRTKFTHAYSSDSGKTYGEEQAHWIDTSAPEGADWQLIHEAYSGKARVSGSFKLYAIESEDGGLTWSEPRCIAAPRNGAQICEPAIIRSPDSKQLCVLLRENSRRYNSFMFTSEDNLKTRSRLRQLPATLTGDRHCARYLKDGRLFISFRDTHPASPTKGDWVAWVGTYDDIINGRQGEYRLRIQKDYGGRGDCAYPGVEILPDGTIVTTTYGHFSPDKPDPFILCAHFKESDIDKNHPILSN